MGALCSCLRPVGASPPKTTLEQLLSFPEIPISSNPSKDRWRRTWDYVETSSSLLTTFPSFPRQFIHSNNLVDVILADILRKLGKEVDTDQERGSSFEWALELAVSAAESTKGASDLSHFSRTPYYHSNVYYTGACSPWIWDTADSLDRTASTSDAAAAFPTTSTSGTVDTPTTSANLRAADYPPEPCWKEKVDSFGTAAFHRGLFGLGITETGPELVLAILEEEADCWTPSAVFKAVVKAVRTANVII
ncbi:hypothetical protein TREMEDRAFT_57868, partial [Tremella mesenterica DSM 1558]|uniref:uncharacterized protein n=1 Tax=Tremella mesenterica (strain ATCC 24925 / CBS 8224 / DSM 1558 / NBRC 9311 / NRRL Y-6157 / RJB 2259-6 / UBC 559-6) TaxID=578456 RepID=UPI00032C6D5F